MLKVRLAALAIILVGGALLARPAEGTYPAPTEPPPPQFCCCIMGWLGCTGQYCCSKTGCSSSSTGCTVQPS